MMDHQLTVEQFSSFKEYLLMEERGAGTIEKYLRDVRDFAAWLDGRPVSRSNVTGAIQALCPDARVEKEKGNPRCLKKLYQTTQAGIQADLALLMEQAYDRILEMEQLTIGWNSSGEASGF